MERNAYLAWRDRKFAESPRSADELVVKVRHPDALTPSELAAIRECLRRANMAIYASAATDTDMARLGRQFGLENLDANWLSGEDGISEIKVSESGNGYIPYTNKPIKWHTDGYYNPPDRKIRAMLLHCVQDAETGGENRLMDHEILYCLLRDENPEYIRALSASDAMTIPERMGEDGVARPEETGPVFSFDPDGNLHMRYTARTRSIRWKQDEATLAAVSAIEGILSSASPHMYAIRLQPGMGIVCNNVLHDRSGFTGNSRLLYRARYLDRIK